MRPDLRGALLFVALIGVLALIVYAIMTNL